MGKRARSARRTARIKASRRSGGEDLSSLPELGSLTELPAYEDLRPHDSQLAAYREVVLACGDDGDAPMLGCVVRLDRGYPAVLTESEVFRAEFVRHNDRKTAERLILRVYEKPRTVLARVRSTIALLHFYFLLYFRICALFPGFCPHRRHGTAPRRPEPVSPRFRV